VKTLWIAFALALPLAAQEGAKSPDCKGCGRETYGTSVDWHGTPTEAGAKAKSDEKLLFLLHVSGYFEDPKFT
jgi:hypothetical protein